MPLPLIIRRAALFLPVWLAAFCPPRAITQTVDSAWPLPNQERLAYMVEWRFIHAGNARLSFNRLAAGSDSGFHVGLELESAGLVSRLFRVNNRYTASLDRQFCAISSQLNASEGSRLRETRVNYDSLRRKASYVERDLRRNVTLAAREIDIPSAVHDVVGGLYYLRTLRATPGQVLHIPVSDGKKSAQARVEAQEREQVATPAGKFQAIRYEVFLFNDVLYRRKGRLFVWLSDDPRRLPVQIRIRLPLYIGTITLQLSKEERS